MPKYCQLVGARRSQSRMGQVSVEGMSHFVNAESDPRSGGWRLILTHVNRETKPIGAVWFGRDSSARAPRKGGGVDGASGINAAKPPSRCDCGRKQKRRDGERGGGWREEEEDKGDPGDSDSGFQARVQTASFALKDRLGCRAAYRSDASETA